MSDIAIKVTNLSKRYRIGMKEEVHDTLTSKITSFLKSPIDNFKRLKKLSKFVNNGEQEDVIWALRDINFEVKHGVALGVIGANGAGKSTLLKVLAQITEPTNGRIEINGRVASLLEVGTGFHPQLTGRENVYLNGTILGMTKREIDKKFDEIVDFSGIEKFIDTPVKRYSSGMRVRLAFSVAAFLEPEILLIDEVLAVGDTEFQAKCIGKMDNIAKRGRTVLFVSHNMAAISSFCQIVIQLEEGGIAFIGKPQAAIDNYYISSSSITNQSEVNVRNDRLKNSNIIRDIRLENNQGNPIDIALTGQDIQVRITYSSEDDLLSSVRVNLYIVHKLFGTIIACKSETTGGIKGEIPKAGSFICKINKLPLVSGIYNLTIGIKHKTGLIDLIENAEKLKVDAGDYFGTGNLNASGIILTDHYWSVE